MMVIKLINIFKKRFKIYISQLILVFAVAAFYFESQPDIYSSEAVIKIETSEINGGINPSFNPLSSLVGLGAIGGDSSRVHYVQERIQAKDFLYSLLASNNNLTFQLLALDGFDAKKKQNIYKKDIFDFDSDEYIGLYKDKEYRNNIARNKFQTYFSTSIDFRSNFITIESETLSPEFSAYLIEQVVLHLNQLEREIDKELYQNINAFVEKSLTRTSVVQIKSVLIDVAAQIQKDLILSNMKEDYLVSYVSHPIPPVYPSMPNRSLLYVLALLISLGVALLCLLLEHTLNRK